MGSKRIVGVFAALVVLALSGCAVEERATVPSVTSSPKATSASPSPTAVGGRAGVPDDAKKHTRAGAEAFARYYLELVNIAWTEPNATVFDDLGSPDCAYCKRMLSSAEELSDKGERYDSPVMRIRHFGEADIEAESDEEWFTATLEQRAANIVNAEGAIVTPQTKDTFQRIILVLWKNGVWYFGDTDVL